MTDALRPLHELDRAALLALNNAHAAELSWLDDARLDRLLGWAALAVGGGADAGGADRLRPIQPV